MECYITRYTLEHVNAYFVLFVVYLKAVVSNPDHAASNDWVIVNSAFARIWKGAIVHSFIHVFIYSIEPFG
jgi:hypothetical protein